MLMSFQVPSNYPRVCNSFLDCWSNAKPINTRLTVSVNGVPLQPLNMLNILEFRPQNSLSWSGSLQLQLSRGMTSFSSTKTVNSPMMLPGTTYRVALLLTTNGWRDLKVIAKLEYNPN
jgi:hypothetical protein